MFRQIKVPTKIVKGKPGEVLKKVIWYEHLFDVIHEAHLHLAHARDPRSHKTHIDQMRWGVTEDAIKVYAQNVYERLSQE
jgi:hypothetical protein